MKRHYFVLFFFGFFPLLAQTLLFRDFLWVFDGNELSVGLFFMSWLVWTAFGAVAGRLLRWFALSRSTFFPLWIATFFPAFIIQNFLIIYARRLAGVTAYELFPAAKLAGIMFLVNFSVSFISGASFVMGSRWLENHDDTQGEPTIMVYVFEALGSFFGAIFVTVALYFKCAPMTIVLCAFLLYVIVVLCFYRFIYFDKVKKRTRVKIWGLLPLAATLVLIFIGTGERVERWRHRYEWNQLLRGGEFQGAFVTPQASYLYGDYGGVFQVLAWNSVIDSFPNTDADLLEVATVVSQKPDAKNVLIVSMNALGSGRVFMERTPVESVTWLAPDKDYPAALLHVMRNQKTDLRIPEMDVREFVGTTNEKFDLIVLDLGEPDTLAMSRFFTREFFRDLSGITTKSGVVCVAFPGGENFLGNELRLIGGSMLATLTAHFQYIALKPGEKSWFFASKTAGVVSDSAELLVTRLETLKKLSEIFPPINLLSFFPKNHIDYQMKCYRAASESSAIVSMDNRPLAMMYALLYTIKQSFDESMTMSVLKRLPEASFWLTAGVFVIYLFFWFSYCALTRSWRARNACLWSRGDSLALLFITSMSGMVLLVAWMFLFQLRFGALFLAFGLISSLFMIGLFGGGLAAKWGVEKVGSRFLFLIATLGFAGFLGAVALAHVKSLTGFAVIFAMTGGFVGGYAPIVIKSLRKNDVDESGAATRVEFVDHIAGAVGGIVGSVCLLPLAGVNGTFACVFICLGVAFILALASRFFAVPVDRNLKKWILLILHVLVAVAVWGIVCRALLTDTEKAKKDVVDRDTKIPIKKLDF